jgi:hypothetical protein
MIALTVRTKRRQLSWRLAAPVAFLLLGIAAIVDPPYFSPFFRFSPGGRGFHKLSATEAVVVVGALWAAVRAWLSAPNRPER